MEQIWKDIPGYKNVYTISTSGKIKSLSRIVSPFGIHDKVIIKEKLLSTQLSNRGYFAVRLTVNGLTKTKMVHRLLAEAFLLNPLNKLEVNHIDGNKLNNNLDNLEWVTSGENQKHAWRIGLRKRFTQEKHPKSRKIKNIDTGKIYNSIKELSIETGIKHSTLRMKLNKGTYQNFVKL